MLSRNVIVEEADFVDTPIETIIDEGERAIYGERAQAQNGPQPDAPQPKKRGRHPQGCTCGRCKWSRPQQPPPHVYNPEKVAMIGRMFTVTGQVVFNRMLKLEPEFSQDSGKLLAEAWLPIIDSYTASPLTMALSITVGVTMPYLAQIGAQLAERERSKREGRNVATS